jgi:hypothetical protein
MLPSLLARDIQNGLKQFLLTGFEPSDDFFHGLMQRFVDEESAWMKGPYLQVGLPFRIGASGRKFLDISRRSTLATFTRRRLGFGWRATSKRRILW